MILTTEQEMIRDAMRTFAQERLAPNAYAWDKHHTFPADALKELGALGAMGMVVPEEWGGAGMDYMSLVLMLEEIAAGDGATSTIVSVQNSLPCGITLKYGTPEQKETWLKPLARGEKLGCFCLTEPHTGSDASALTTRADRDGDHFVLNGVKQFITTGKHADVAIVFAVTDKAAGKKGISCFLVPTSTPGYVVARIEEKMGQHASDTAQILFDNCRVPATALLGPEGEGYKIALSALEGGRMTVSELYGHIQRDPRHKDVVLLHYEEIAERRFAGWTMGEVNMNRINASILLKYAEKPVLDPYSVSGQVSLALLDELMATASIIGRA